MAQPISDPELRAILADYIRYDAQGVYLRLPWRFKELYLEKVLTAGATPTAGVIGQVLGVDANGLLSWGTPSAGYVITANAAGLTPVSSDLLTPPSAGQYLVTVSQRVTVANSAGNLATVIGWTDDIGATTAKVAPDLDTSAVGRAQGSVVIRALATAPITRTHTLSGLSGTPTYRVEVAAVRLAGVPS